MSARGRAPSVSVGAVEYDASGQPVRKAGMKSKVEALKDASKLQVMNARGRIDMDEDGRRHCVTHRAKKGDDIHFRKGNGDANLDLFQQRLEADNLKRGIQSDAAVASQQSAGWKKRPSRRRSL